MKFFPNQKTCYIQYEQKEQAVEAIIAANGKKIENESMVCNWGIMCTDSEDFFDSTPLKYSTVFEQSSDLNFTVFCSGFINTTEKDIRSAFNCFGEIASIAFQETQAHVTFTTKESACTAMVGMHGKYINDNRVYFMGCPKILLQA